MTVGKTGTIKCLELGQVFKYLRVDESNGIQHSLMWETIRREYFCRVKMVLRTELYVWIKILAINGFALPILTYDFGLIGGLRTCSSFIDGKENFSLCTEPTIMQQTLTGCICSVHRGLGSRGLHRSIQIISFVLLGWTLTFVAALIFSYKWYKSVMLRSPPIRFDAWPVSLLHSCRGVSIRTTSRKVCTEGSPSCVMLSLSKRLRQTQNISVRAAVIIVYSPGVANQCIVSITVLL